MVNTVASVHASSDAVSTLRRTSGCGKIKVHVIICEWSIEELFSKKKKNVIKALHTNKAESRVSRGSSTARASWVRVNVGAAAPATAGEEENNDDAEEDAESLNKSKIDNWKVLTVKL